MIYHAILQRVCIGAEIVFCVAPGPLTGEETSNVDSRWFACQHGSMKCSHHLSAQLFATLLTVLLIAGALTSRAAVDKLRFPAFAGNDEVIAAALAGDVD